MLRQVYARTDKVVLREIAGERFLIPFSGHLADMQRIYSLEGVGAEVWQRLDGAAPLAAIVAELEAAYAVSRAELERDVLDFVGALADAGLVRGVSA